MMPPWIDHPPEDHSYVYIVGESIPSKQKEDALQQAWNSALIRLAISEFPELIQLISKSRETLRDSEFERSTIQNFQLINWKGLREMKSLGSPFVSYDEKSGSYTAYRLLTWSLKDRDMAKKEANESLDKIKKSSEAIVKIYKVPLTPEEAELSELQISNQLDQLRRLNIQIKSKDEIVEKILKELKCGTKVTDVLSLLGEPDHKNYYSVVYGTYILSHYRDNFVNSIKDKLGNGEERFLCK